MTSHSSVPAQAIPGAGSDPSSGSTSTPSGGAAPNILNSLNDTPSSLPGVDSFATADEARQAAASPPIDPSKLNNQPAALPTSPRTATEANTSPMSPPLRDGTGQSPLAAGAAPGGADNLDSAYLDTGMPVEPSSHPTIAETGVLSSSPNQGPRQGQLKRVEKKADDAIISLGSLGGEGLKMKPPVQNSPSEQ
ncbi:hypothetical protein IAU60_005399 [Kwoniella sp. DSM 27419]